MQKKKLWMLLLATAVFFMTAKSQSLPGDSLVFGPTFSPVFNDSVRIWVLTKDSTHSGNKLSINFSSDDYHVLFPGTLVDADDRLGYHLRSYIYKIYQGTRFTAEIFKNNIGTGRKSFVWNTPAYVVDFEFQAAGSGPVNGNPTIFNTMVEDRSDLMVWLGNATYLMPAQPPDTLNDWANKDKAFARYFAYRKFQDTLLRAMPQLAIADKHDLGPNEYDKTMPTLADTKQTFMNWWPNPHYNSTSEGPGLFSSYKLMDVEYFLLDNRSYRDSSHYLGSEQLEWLKQGLLHSKTNFKILVSGTPAFDKHWGTGNFSTTAEADELVAFIRDHNIDGVICLSGAINEQSLYGRYDENLKYPLFDLLSGNLNADTGTGQFTVDYNNENILSGTKQTFLRILVHGIEHNRRLKIDYVGANDEAYFTTYIHEQMLKSIDDSSKNLWFTFDGNAAANDASIDSTRNPRLYQFAGINYTEDRFGNKDMAALFRRGSEINAFHASGIDFNDRSFSFACWVSPSQLTDTGSSVFSNTKFTMGFDKEGHPYYINHTTNERYISTAKLSINKWTHLLWKLDNVRHRLWIYYNGVEVGNWTNVMPPEFYNASLSIGYNFEKKYFIGSLDEVNIYSKLLSDTAILGLSGHMNGDALRLSDTSRMVIPSNVLNTTLSKDFTIEFWAKLNADPGNTSKILSSTGLVNNLTTGISFEYTDNNKLNIVAGTNGSDWNTIADKGNIWNIGEWNHIAITATQNDSLIYYINGEKVGATTFASYVPNTTGMGLGYSPSYGNNLAADMDELRIWNIALSQDSIKKHMHYPLSGQETGLQLYYNFGTHTDTTFISTGAISDTIAFNGGSLVAGTDPVADITPLYKDTVSANWSRSNIANAGLIFPDKISNYYSNIVTGKNNDHSFGSKNDLFFLKGGWEIAPLNLSFTDIKINLPQALPSYDSIAIKAGTYYLLNSDSLVIVSEGVLDSTNVTFHHVLLDKGIYYLAWNVDSTRILPPVAGFKADTTVVITGNSVVFTDTSKYNTTDNSLISRNWIFTGGTPAVSTDAISVIVYNIPGTYDVTLSASNSAGTNTLTKQQYILVKDTIVIIPDAPSKHVKIYPNPTDGPVTIEFKSTQGENVSLELFDMLGKKLAQVGSYKATGTLQKLQFNVAPYIKHSQALLIIIRTAHQTTKRLLFYSR